MTGASGYRKKRDSNYVISLFCRNPDMTEMLYLNFLWGSM